MNESDASKLKAIAQRYSLELRNALAEYQKAVDAFDRGDAGARELLDSTFIAARRAVKRLQVFLGVAPP